MKHERRVYVLYDYGTGLFYTGDAEEHTTFFTKDIERARQYPLPGRAEADIARLKSADRWLDDDEDRIVCPEVRVRGLRITYELD